MVRVVGRSDHLWGISVGPLLEQGIEAQQKEIAVGRVKQEAQAEQMQERQLRIDELHRLHQQAQVNLEYYRESSRVQRLTDQETHNNQLNQVQHSFKVSYEKCPEKVQPRSLVILFSSC